ncbi:unnamed protein product, partial [Lampetra fluviatilis]
GGGHIEFVPVPVELPEEEELAAEEEEEEAVAAAAAAAAQSAVSESAPDQPPDIYVADADTDAETGDLLCHGTRYTVLRGEVIATYAAEAQ